MDNPLSREDASKVLKGFIFGKSDLAPEKIMDNSVIFTIIGDDGVCTIKNWVEANSSVSELSVHFVSLNEVTVGEILDCFGEAL